MRRSSKGQIELTIVAMLIRIVQHIPLWRIFDDPKSALDVTAFYLGELSVKQRRTIAVMVNCQRLASRYLFKRIAILPHLPVSELIRCDFSESFEDAIQNRRPKIIVAWHCGIVPCLFKGLAKLDQPTMIIKSPEAYSTLVDGLDVQMTSQSDNSNSFAHGIMMKRIVDRLKSGENLLTFLDGTDGNSSLPVRFFGQKILLERGTAHIARLSGAEIFPCVSYWDEIQGEFVVEVCDRLVPNKPEEPGDYTETDRVLLHALAGWFENYLRQHPECLTGASDWIVKYSNRSLNPSHQQEAQVS